MAAKKKSNKPSASKDQPIENFMKPMSPQPVNYNAKWADAIATVRKADEAKYAMQKQGNKDLKAYQQAKIAEYNDAKVRATKIKDVGKGGVSYTERSSGSSIMRNMFRFGGGGLKNSGK